jgi:lipocalin
MSDLLYIYLGDIISALRGSTGCHAGNFSSKGPLSRTLVPSVSDQVHTSKRMMAKMAYRHSAIKGKSTPSDGGFTGKRKGVFTSPLNEKNTLVRRLLIQYLCLINKPKKKDAYILTRQCRSNQWPSQELSL